MTGRLRRSALEGLGGMSWYGRTRIKVFWKQVPGTSPRQADLGGYAGQRLGTPCDRRF